MNDLSTRPRLAFGAIASVVLFAAMPGLAGGWVGDDFHMLTSRYYGDWTQIGGVFTRHAGHYLSEGETSGATWPYRPVTMLTLLLSHAVVPKPWLHHLVSWLLHIGTGVLLFVTLRRQASPADRAWAGPIFLVLTALFLLHPVAVEAYVWINGRSDLLAGLCLAALAAVLSNQDVARSRQGILVALLAFLGAGSKLPFIPAAIALWLGLALRSSKRRQLWRMGLPLVAGVGCYLALRTVYVPLAGRVGASESVVDDLSTWAAVPHLLGKSAHALLTFQAEAMQSLAWELSQPLSLGDWVGAIAMVVAGAFLAWRRDFGGLVLILGFAATVTPCVIVSRTIWLGFDRYLYLPLILVLLAGAPYVVATVEVWPRRRALGRALAGMLILVAALGTRSSSLAYVSQTTYERAMIVDHPDDPTIAFYLARMAKQSGQLALAQQTLAQMPEPPWPSALIMPAFALAIELSDVRTRDLAIEHGLRVHSKDPIVRAHGMRWKYQRGEIGDALALARSFGADDTLCPEVRRQLELWLRDADIEPKRERIRETARGLRCLSNAP